MDSIEIVVEDKNEGQKGTFIYDCELCDYSSKSCEDFQHHVERGHDNIPQLDGSSSEELCFWLHLSKKEQKVRYWTKIEQKPPILQRQIS